MDLIYSYEREIYAAAIFATAVVLFLVAWDE